MNTYTRRDWIRKSIITGGIIPIAWWLKSQRDTLIAPDLQVNIFSKHLQFLDFKDMAAAASKIGFDGVDLTVRPGGHVLPENAARDLPLAVEAIRSQGLNCDMITTAITEARSETSQTVLKTAASLGIKYFRTGYFKYANDQLMPEALKVFNRELHELAKFCAPLGLRFIHI